MGSQSNSRYGATPGPPIQGWCEARSRIRSESAIETHSRCCLRCRRKANCPPVSIPTGLTAPLARSPNLHNSVFSHPASLAAPGDSRSQAPPPFWSRASVCWIVKQTTAVDSDKELLFIAVHICKFRGMVSTRKLVTKLPQGRRRSNGLVKQFPKGGLASNCTQEAPKLEDVCLGPTAYHQYLCTSSASAAAVLCSEVLFQEPQAHPGSRRSLPAARRACEGATLGMGSL